MEQDKQLKNILLNSTDRASARFTDAVMQKINGLAAAPFNYLPLVDPQLKRIFVFIFGFVIASILSLSLIIALTNVQVVTWLQNKRLPGLDYRTIFFFIGSFWIVFTINSFIEKKFLIRKQSGLEAR